MTSRKEDVTILRLISIYLELSKARLSALVVAAGPVYAAGSVLLGLGLLFLGVRLFLRRTALEAKRLFLASVVYLPLLLGLLALDRGPASGLSRPARAESARSSHSLARPEVRGDLEVRPQTLHGRP